VSPLANGGRPWKRERMRGINGEGCGRLERVGILIRIKILENRNSFGLWRKEREIKKRRKGKEFDK